MAREGTGSKDKQTILKPQKRGRCVHWAVAGKDEGGLLQTRVWLGGIRQTGCGYRCRTPDAKRTVHGCFTG